MPSKKLDKKVTTVSASTFMETDAEHQINSKTIEYHLVKSVSKTAPKPTVKKNVAATKKSLSDAKKPNMISASKIFENQTETKIDASAVTASLNNEISFSESISLPKKVVKKPTPKKDNGDKK